jgi:hypothetical protein
MFKEDLERCREITYALWDHRGFAQRLSELFSWIWEPYY